MDCATIPTCSKDNSKTADDTVSNNMVMVVHTVCEFSLLVSHQNHSDVSIKVLNDELKWFYKKKGNFVEELMLKSANAKVDDQLPRESNQVWEPMIDISFQAL